MTVKYQAKYVYYDLSKRVVLSSSDVEIWRYKGTLKLPKRIVRFDSQHEFKVYLELCRMYGFSKVHLQVPIEIIPSCYCYPKGKRWKVDFAIKNHRFYDAYEHYVEAKGACLAEFTTVLTQVENHSPAVFDRLTLVFSRKIPTKNKVIGSLLKSPFAERIITLKQLKEIPDLS